MMNKDILNVVEVVSNEKGVEKEIIFEAMEAALALSLIHISEPTRPY